MRRSTTTQSTILAESPSDEIANFNDVTFEEEISGNVIEDGPIVAISETDVEALSERPGEFTVEYVNTVLENSVPNVKVLQCWSEFNLCFIQLGPHPTDTQHLP